MPWYYAGPEAKPVGPVSLEELHARRLSGAILPETYVIERTGQASESLAWKPYKEVFPTSPSLPWAPPAPLAFPPSLPPPPAQPHPLFPSAAPVPGRPSPFPDTPRPDSYYSTEKTNPWCAWGFILALAGLCFVFCGGFFLALPALFLCGYGLTQVHQHPKQSGRGLAISGLVLAGLALLISLVLISWIAWPYIKAHEQTTTEQTSNDSQ